MSDWFDTLTAAQRAGCPGAILRFNTSDRVFSGKEASKAMSLPYFLATAFHEEGHAVAYVSLSTGLQRLAPPGAALVQHDVDAVQGVTHTVVLFQRLTRILRTRGQNPLVLVVDYAEHVVPAQGQAGIGTVATDQLQILEFVHTWSVEDEIRRSGNFVVLIERGGSVNSLPVSQGRFAAIDIPLPGDDARSAYMERILSAEARGLDAMLEKGLDSGRFARVSSGLRLTDIEAIFRGATAAGRDVSLEMITTRKRTTINELCGGLLEVVEPNRRGFDAVAGNYNAKAYFRHLKPLWSVGSQSIPLGILLAGVPGTGKSFLISAVAKEFDIPCVAMRSVREMWVGQSERNLERVLATLDSLAPCLLWSDEVDQTIGQNREVQAGGDSGTSSRMLARFLEFMGDSARRGKVLWIGTTNRPDLLDPAMRSRFQVCIPFLHARGNELTELWPELFRQVEREFVGSFDEIPVAGPRFDTMSARSLIELISLAGLLADAEAGRPSSRIARTHVERALDEVEPEFDDGTIKRIALTALLMTRWNLLLPWRAMGSAKAAENGWPRYLDPFVDPETGLLRRPEIARELGLEAA